VRLLLQSKLLRDRRGDLLSLVRHFVGIYAERMNKQIDGIPADVMEVLVGHSWPGNIRELQNFIERNVILTDGNTLHPPLEGLRQQTRSYLINGFVAEKPQNLFNRNQRKIMIRLSLYSFTTQVPSFPRRAGIYEMASSEINSPEPTTLEPEPVTLKEIERHHIRKALGGPTG